MEADELLDLVDAQNNTVGTVMREAHHKNIDAYNKKGQFWRGVACFLVNPKDEVWIPRRQPWRTITPGGLDYSMAEHVKSGESHLEGAVRGMQEELNLQVHPTDLKKVAQLFVKQIGCIMEVFILETDTNKVNFNTSDYQSGEWLSIDSLKAKLEDPHETYKSAMPEAINAVEDYIRLREKA